MKTKAEPGGRLDVLCLEDEPRDAELVREMLVDAGYDVTLERVAGETGFVTALKTRRPDVIIFDYTLPGFSADAALRCALQLRPGVPLICVSGTIGEDTAVELLKQGATDYVLKDRMGRLAFAVRRALESARAEQERRRVEESLRTRDTQLRFVIDHAPVCIAYCDAQRRYKFANRLYGEMLGRPADDLVGRQVREALGEEAYAVVSSHMDAVLKGHAVEFDQEQVVAPGKKRMVHVGYVPEFDAAEQVVGFVAAIVDISERQQAEAKVRAVSTELARLLATAKESRLALLSVVEDHKEAEAALRTSEERFRRAITDAPFPIMLHAEDGEVLQVSNSWCEISGYARGELQTVADWAERAYGERQQPVRAEIETLYSLGSAKAEGDFPIRTKTGVMRIWDFSSAPLGRLADGRRLVISMAMDVTERRQAEADLKNSLHEKEALLKEVHHRVKNNLQVITSLLRLEAGKHRDSATGIVLGDMQSRIRSMALLHETLYRTGNFARVNLADYLRQLATQLFRAQNAVAGTVRLTLNLTKAEVEIDQAIPCGLIVNELLTNSLKHAFPAGRSGEVQLALQTGEDGRVRLQVSDDGVGLPSDLDLKKTQSLGLQLVSDLTGQLQGTLEMVPSGTGSVFSIAFTAHKEPKGDLT